MMIQLPARHPKFPTDELHRSAGLGASTLFWASSGVGTKESKVGSRYFITPVRIIDSSGTQVLCTSRRIAEEGSELIVE